MWTNAGFEPSDDLRYVALGLIVYMTAATATLMFADIDPYFALFNFWTSEVAIGGVIILVAVLLLSLLVERPFCKYACPIVVSPPDSKSTRAVLHAAPNPQDSSPCIVT